MVATAFQLPSDAAKVRGPPGVAFAEAMVHTTDEAALATPWARSWSSICFRTLSSLILSS
eukprot:674375-Heterocapsa_arctica.AAC.1